MSDRRENFDLGDKLNAKPSPIASESRLFVFIAGTEPFDLVGMEMEDAWTKWAGKTVFVPRADERDKCGICIFWRGTLNAKLAGYVREFLDKGGAEANVFEYRPETKNFTRVCPHYFDAYYARAV